MLGEHNAYNRRLLPDRGCMLRYHICNPGQHVTAAVQAECACCNMLVCSAHNIHSKLLPMTAGSPHSIDNVRSLSTLCSVMKSQSAANLQAYNKVE